MNDIINFHNRIFFSGNKAPMLPGCFIWLAESVRVADMKFKDTTFNPIPYEAHMQAFSLIEKGRKVLDLGCSTGYFARKLKEKNCRVIGVEIDPEATKIAKKYCEEAFSADILKLHSLPIPKKSFDIILMLDVLEHLEDPEKALSMVRAYIRREGKLIISVPNIAHVSVRLALFFGKFDYKDTGILSKSHLRFFTKKTLIGMVKEVDFKIEKLDYSADFGQLPFLGRFLKRVPKKLQYQVTKTFNTFLAMQFIVVCR